MTRHLSIGLSLLLALPALAGFQPPPVSQLVVKHAPTNQVVNLAWNAPADPTVAGYNIYWTTQTNLNNPYGFNSEWTSIVNVGNTTNCPIKLPLFSSSIVRFWFAATSYNSSGVQSVFSNLISFSGNGLVVCFTNWTWPTNTVQASSDLVKWSTASWQQSLCQTNPTTAMFCRLINTNTVYGSVAQVKGAQLLRQPLVVLPPPLPNIAVNSYTVKLP